MTVTVRDPVATMSRGLDDLRTTLSGLDDKGVTQTLRDIEALSRVAQSVMLDVVAEAEERGIAVRFPLSIRRALVADVAAGIANGSEEHQAAARARSTHLTLRGATLLRELDEPAGWCLVVADPEGNEFCLH